MYGYTKTSGGTLCMHGTTPKWSSQTSWTDLRVDLFALSNLYSSKGTIGVGGGPFGILLPRSRDFTQ